MDGRGRAKQEKVRPGTGREAGLGHARAESNAWSSYREGQGEGFISYSDPLSPTLPLRGRERNQEVC
jgi:hypothetical protein